MEYQNIDISTWTQVGEGGNGKTYVHPGHPDFLLKVNNPPRCDEATVKQERDAAQHVFDLGIPTPRMFDMVRVGDGYGQLVEIIKGKSLFRVFARMIRHVSVKWLSCLLHWACDCTPCLAIRTFSQVVRILP